MIRIIHSLVIILFVPSLLAQSSSPFSEAAQVRGSLLPFQFPVNEGEFRSNEYGDFAGHLLISPSSLETNLRNYSATLQDFRNQPGMSGYFEGMEERLATAGIPARDIRVVMRKNERGFYIPQLVRPRRLANGELAPWDPEYPARGMQFISSNHEDQIFRADANGNARLVGCRSTISNERIQNGECAIPQPRQRSCGFDPYIRDTGKNFQEISESNFTCTKGPNQPTNEYLCMACNLYFESRGEGSLGMEAVAELTLADQAHQVRRGRAGSSPICDAVYKANRFSWTLGNAEVDVSRVRDWHAWQQALYISTQTAHMSGQSNPPIHDPKLHCYRYYVSTITFQNFEQLPGWARTYYDQTLNMGDNFRPLCVGNHIFMRDPNERNCPQPDISRTRENDMDSETHRRMFFNECLSVDEPHEVHQTPPAPNTQLCSENTIERAIRAHRATGVDNTPPGIYSPESEVAE